MVYNIPIGGGLMVTIIAYVYGKKEKTEELKQSLIHLGKETRKEAGNMEFIMHQEEDDPSTFFFYEIYSSEETFQSHLNSDHVQGFVKNAETNDLFRDEVKIIRLTKTEL
jgi:quinol monooxygenase YgiN